MGIRGAALYLGSFFPVTPAYPPAPTPWVLVSAENISKGKIFPLVLLTSSVQILLQFLNVAVTALRSRNSSLGDAAISSLPHVDTKINIRRLTQSPLTNQP